MRNDNKKSSEVIQEIVDDCVEDETVTVEEFLEKMGSRALALAILVFALSAVVAGVIPGFSTIMAIPILFMAVQMVLNRGGLYLPPNIRKKKISPKVIKGALAQSIPTIRKVEKFLKPRLLWLTNCYFEKLIAIVIIILAGILALPIPAGNFLPSFTISLLALALLERDGLLLLLTIFTLYFTGTLMIELINQAWHLLHLLVTGSF